VTVGQANGVNNGINLDTVVRVASSSPRMPVTRVSRTGGLQAAQGETAGTSVRNAPESISIAGRSPGMRVGVFFNLDGDSAELTGRAMNPYRGASMGDGPTPSGQGGATGVIINAQLDLPSAIVDWEDYAKPHSSLELLNQPPPDSEAQAEAAPQSAWPAAPPQEVVLPKVPLKFLAPAETKAPANETSAVSLEALKPAGECKTCANRKYVDDSNDPSVSFQTPTSVSAGMSMAAVASHENEHVSNERAKASRDGREIVNQSVSYTYDCCPECGRSYVSGGNTRTVSIEKSSEDNSDPEASAPGAPG